MLQASQVLTLQTYECRLELHASAREIFENVLTSFQFQFQKPLRNQITGIGTLLRYDEGEELNI